MSDLSKNLSKLYPFNGRWFEAKSGHLMHYLDEGVGDPVIMVHGNPTWSFYYRNLVLALKSQYRCIVPDHIGCGLSDKPHRYQYSYNLKNRINDLVHLVEHLNLKKFNLIVHDWGGAIGLGMAQHFPDRLGKVVLLNTAAFTAKKIPCRINFLKTPVLGPLLIQGANAFAKSATTMAVKKPLDPLVKKAYLFPYDTWNNRVATLKFVQDIPMAKTHPSWKCLKQIENNLDFLNEKETMICWGGSDFCFNDHFFEEWKHRIPNAIVHYYPDAGHYVLEDAGPEILGCIQSFFK